MTVQAALFKPGSVYSRLILQFSHMKKKGQ